MIQYPAMFGIGVNCHRTKTLWERWFSTKLRPYLVSLHFCFNDNWPNTFFKPCNITMNRWRLHVVYQFARIRKDRGIFLSKYCYLLNYYDRPKNNGYLFSSSSITKEGGDLSFGQSISQFVCVRYVPLWHFGFLKKSHDSRS